MADPHPGTERDELLDRVADIGGFDRSSPQFDDQDPIFRVISSRVALDRYVAHHPDRSLRMIATTAAVFVRRLAEAAGRLEPRPFGRLCLDMRFDFISEVEQRLREDVTAWETSLGTPTFLFGDPPEAVDRPGVNGNDGLSVSDGEPEHALGLGDRSASAAASPSFAHAVLPLLIGAALGAGATMMLRRPGEQQARRQAGDEPSLDQEIPQ